MSGFDCFLGQKMIFFIIHSFSQKEANLKNVLYLTSCLQDIIQRATELQHGDVLCSNS